MSVVQSYAVGGVIDKIKEINWPAHLFPKFTNPYVKGMRIDVPPVAGVFSTTYTCPTDMELINVAIACSGYMDTDEWEVIATQPGQDPYTIVETMPTRELAESINMGNVLYIVYRLVAGSTIRFDFHNNSQSTKTVWPSMRFLRP